MQLKGLVTENLWGMEGYTTEGLEKTENKKPSGLLSSAHVTLQPLQASISVLHQTEQGQAPSFWIFARVELDHPCRARSST